MCASSVCLHVPAIGKSLSDRFLGLLPRIERHIRMFFCKVRCAARKADCVAEAIALTWKWFLRLYERGRDPTQFPIVLAQYACRAIQRGRQLCGQGKSKDILNPRAQQKYGFRVESLPSSMRMLHKDFYGLPRGQRMPDVFEERLRENTRTPVPDQVCFRVDFRVWLETLTARERQIIRAMALNERTKDLSHRFSLSPGRISQLRRDFEQRWKQFCSE
jgi:hypothetical protein